jgi:hypothetical protein
MDGFLRRPLRQCVQSPLAVATDDPGRNRPHRHSARRLVVSMILLLKWLNGKIDRHKG